MDRLSDIPLAAPISQTLLKGLLFTSFTFHMLFVLLALGTAMLALYYFIDSRREGHTRELRLDKSILKTFMAHKSLAVVLGVAPLLLIQVGYTVPFFTAVNLFAPYWMSVIAFLIVAFLAFDILGHRIYVHRYIHLASGVVAIIALLAVPGFFSAILTAFENPDHWQDIINNGYRLTSLLAVRWLFRYLHVLGAALVCGAGFHYFFTARNETEKNTLQKWLVAGILLQFILGAMLYGVFPSNTGRIDAIYLFTGITSASFLMWLIFLQAQKGLSLNIRIILPVFMLVLTSMLLTRQSIQDRALIPFQKGLAVNAAAYGNELKPFEQQTLAGYGAALKVVYDNGGTIYARSCAFCHGRNGDGNGAEASRLSIPPEDIQAVRTDRGYLYEILKNGVHGSAMPYFTFFDKGKLDSLMDYMDRRWHILSPPEAVSKDVSSQAMAQAMGAYAKTCSTCHGMSGKGSKSSRGLEPSPPDLTAYSLSPGRTFNVISNGYPGAMMPAFGGLPEEVRWGLVKIVYKKRVAH